MSKDKCFKFHCWLHFDAILRQQTSEVLFCVNIYLCFCSFIAPIANPFAPYASQNISIVHPSISKPVLSNHDVYMLIHHCCVMNNKWFNFIFPQLSWNASILKLEEHNLRHVIKFMVYLLTLPVPPQNVPLINRDTLAGIKHRAVKKANNILLTLSRVARCFPTQNMGVMNHKLTTLW